MKAFAFVFVCLAIYGLFTGHFGGALFSLAMACFVIIGTRQLDKRDAEFEASPASAKPVPNADTLEAMREQAAEAGRSTF